MKNTNKYLIPQTLIPNLFLSTLILLLFGCGHSELYEDEVNLKNQQLSEKTLSISDISKKNTLIPNRNYDITIKVRQNLDVHIITPSIQFDSDKIEIEYNSDKIENNQRFDLPKLKEQTQDYYFTIKYNGNSKRVNLPIKLYAQYQSSKVTLMEEKILSFKIDKPLISTTISYTVNSKKNVYNNEITLGANEKIDFEFKIINELKSAIDNNNILSITNYVDIANHIKIYNNDILINEDNNNIKFNDFSLINETSLAILSLKGEVKLLAHESSKTINIKYKINNSNYYDSKEGSLKINIIRHIIDYKQETKLNNEVYTYRENEFKQTKVNDTFILNVVINNIDEVSGNTNGINKIIFSPNADFFDYFTILNNPQNLNEFPFSKTQKDNKEIEEITLTLLAKRATTNADNLIEYAISNTENVFNTINERIKYKINKIDYEESVKIVNIDNIESNEFYVGETFKINIEIANLINTETDSYLSFENWNLFKNNVRTNQEIDFSKPQKLKNILNYTFNILKPLSLSDIKIKLYDQSKTEASNKSLVYNTKTIPLPILFKSGKVDIIGELSNPSFVIQQNGQLTFKIIKNENNQDDISDYKFKIVRKEESTISGNKITFKSSKLGVNKTFTLGTVYPLNSDISTGLSSFEIPFETSDEAGIFKFNLVIINKQNEEFIRSYQIKINNYKLNLRPTTPVQNNKYKIYKNVEINIPLEVYDANIPIDKIGINLISPLSITQLEKSIENKTIKLKLITTQSSEFRLEIKGYNINNPSQNLDGNDKLILYFNEEKVKFQLKMVREIDNLPKYQNVEYTISSYKNDRIKDTVYPFTPQFEYTHKVLYQSNNAEVPTADYMVEGTRNEDQSSEYDYELTKVVFNKPNTYIIKVILTEKITGYSESIESDYTISDYKNEIDFYISENTTNNNLNLNQKYEINLNINSNINSHNPNWKLEVSIIPANIGLSFADRTGNTNSLDTKYQIILTNEHKIPNSIFSIKFKLTDTKTNIFKEKIKEYSITHHYNIETKINNSFFTFRENDENTVQIINVKDEFILNLVINNIDEITSNDKGINKISFDPNADIFKYFAIKNNNENNNEFNFNSVQRNNKEVDELTIVLLAKRSATNENNFIEYSISNSENLFKRVNQKIKYKINSIDYTFGEGADADIHIKILDNGNKPRNNNKFYIDEVFKITIQTNNLLDSQTDNYFLFKNWEYLSNNQYIINLDNDVDFSEPQKLTTSTTLLYSFRVLKPLISSEIELKLFDQSKTDNTKQNIVYNSKDVKLPVSLVSGNITVVSNLSKPIFTINDNGILNFEIIKEKDNQDNISDYKFKIIRKEESTVKANKMIFKSSNTSNSEKFTLNTAYPLNNRIHITDNKYSILFETKDDIGLFRFNLIVINKQNKEYVSTHEIEVEKYKLNFRLKNPVANNKYKVYRNVPLSFLLEIFDTNFSNDKIGFKLKSSLSDTYLEKSSTSNSINLKLISTQTNEFSVEIEGFHKDQPDYNLDGNDKIILYFNEDKVNFDLVNVRSIDNLPKYQNIDYTLSTYKNTWVKSTVYPFAPNFTPQFEYTQSVGYQTYHTEVPSSVYKITGVNISSNNLYDYELTKVKFNRVGRFTIQVILTEKITGYRKTISNDYTISDYTDKIMFSISDSSENGKIYVNTPYKLNVNINKENGIPAFAPVWLLEADVVQPNNSNITFLNRRGTFEQLDKEFNFLISKIDTDNNLLNTNYKIRFKLTDTLTKTYKIVEKSYNLFNKLTLERASISNALHSLDLKDRLIKIKIKDAFIYSNANLKIKVEAFLNDVKSNSFTYFTPRILVPSKKLIIKTKDADTFETGFISNSYNGEFYIPTSTTNNLAGNLFYKITISDNVKILSNIDTNTISINEVESQNSILNNAVISITTVYKLDNTQTPRYTQRRCTDWDDASTREKFCRNSNNPDCGCNNWETTYSHGPTNYIFGEYYKSIKFNNITSNHYNNIFIESAFGSSINKFITQDIQINSDLNILTYTNKYKNNSVQKRSNVRPEGRKETLTNVEKNNNIKILLQNIKRSNDY